MEPRLEEVKGGKLSPPSIPPVKSDVGDNSAVTDFGGTFSTVRTGEGHPEPREELPAAVPPNSPGPMRFNILLNSAGGTNFRILSDGASSSKQSEFNLSIGQVGEISIKRNSSNG